jgi:hypothetical protein
VRIVGNPHRFSMPRGSGAHDLILSSAGRAAVISGNRINDATDMLEHTLDTQKHPPARMSDSVPEPFGVSSPSGAGRLRSRTAPLATVPPKRPSRQMPRRAADERAEARDRVLGFPRHVSLHFQTALKMSATPFMQ